MEPKDTAASDTQSYNLTSSAQLQYNSSESGGEYLRNICAQSVMTMELPQTTILHELQHYLSGVCVFIICVLGLIGNSLAIRVMLRKEYVNTSTYVYLTGLTVSDSLFLVFDILLCVKDLLSKNSTLALAGYPGTTFPVFHPLANTFHCTSIWLTLGFTVDRYIMICHPFEGSKFCTRKRAIFTVVGIYIFGFLYNIPRFLEYETYVLPNLFSDKKYTIAIHTEIGASQVFLKVIHFWMYLFCVFLIPCVTLSVLNTLLLVTVKRSRIMGRRMSLGVDPSPKNDTTIMLVAVVVVFLVCQLPALIIKTIFASQPEKFVRMDSKYDYLNIIQEVANFLVIVNSAINIILYCGFSKRFRKTFAQIFCYKCHNSSKLIVSEFTQRISMSKRESGMCESVMSKSRLSDPSLAGILAVSNGRQSIGTRKGPGGTDYQGIPTFAPLPEENSHEKDPMTMSSGTRNTDVISLNNLNKSDLARKDSGIWLKNNITCSEVHE